MSALGLDIGEKRIGVAIGDDQNAFAVPVEVIDRSFVVDLWEKLEECAASRRADLIVVGMPFSLNGEVGPQAEKTWAFVNELKRKSSLPIEIWDEQYSSVEANRLLTSNLPRNASHKKALRLRRSAKDAVAASVMLQSYLDSKINLGRSA